MSASSEKITARSITCPPRIPQASAAPAYLGICRTKLNNTVRPYVREFNSHAAKYYSVAQLLYLAINLADLEHQQYLIPTPASRTLVKDRTIINEGCDGKLYAILGTILNDFGSGAIRLATFISSPADFYGGIRTQHSKGEHR